MAPSITPRRILVVDDSPLVLEIARLALEGAGWEVDAAESGGEALSRSVAAPPDALLLDVEMPDMDGPATLAALRADPATVDVPVVFLTGHSDPHKRERLASLDVRGVLPKPFDVARLSADVAAVLGWDR
jgi:CheY-like chemotaxis protein